MKSLTRVMAAVVSMLLLQAAVAANAYAQQVTMKNGVLEGTLNAATGLRSFKGIPFAAPPVGPLWSN